MCLETVRQNQISNFKDKFPKRLYLYQFVVQLTLYDYISTYSIDIIKVVDLFYGLLGSSSLWCSGIWQIVIIIRSINFHVSFIVFTHLVASEEFLVYIYFTHMQLDEAEEFLHVVLTGGR